MDKGDLLNYTLVAAAIGLVSVPLFGYLSDLIGRRLMYGIGIVGTAVFAFPYYGLLDTGKSGLVLLAIVASLIFHDMQYGPQAALIAERFGTNVRYSGAGLGYQLASVIAGGPAPLIAAKILEDTGSSTWISWYIVGCCAIAMIALISMPDRREMPEDEKVIDLDDVAARGVVGIRPQVSQTAPDGRSSPAAQAGSGPPAYAGWPPTGCTSTVADLDGEAADKVARDVGGEAWQVDLADTAALADLSLDVDVLVNNAGIQHVAPVHEFPPERFAAILALMVEAPFLLARAALPGMYERGFGRVVNISSVHGLVASPFKSAYVAAKHGARGAVQGRGAGGRRARRDEQLRLPRLRAYPVGGEADRRPGAVHGIDEAEVVEQVMLTETAIKRLVEPDEVAELVAWVAGPAAGYVNGASLTMDGGWTAR